MIFSPHDSPFILVFTADARSVGNSQLSYLISTQQKIGQHDQDDSTRCPEKYSELLSLTLKIIVYDRNILHR